MHSKTGVLLQSINCGYTLELPRKIYQMCTLNLHFEKKNQNKLDRKFEFLQLKSVYYMRLIA